MIKKLLLFAFCFVSTSLMAQGNYEYYLDRIRANDNLDSVVYYYDNNYRMTSYLLTTPDGDSSLQLIDSLFYDENGNITTIRTYQKMAAGWISSTYLVYTYDELNRRITRTNYNNMGNGFQIQGVYTYTYDDNDHIIYHEMTLGGSLYERCYYTYNSDGYLTQEIGETTPPWNDIVSWENAFKTTYEYDVNHNMTLATYYYWDGASWTSDTRDVNTYDANNNSLSSTHFQVNNIASRYKYYYNTELSIEKYKMPYHPEPFYTEFAQFVNVPTYYSWETADEDWNLIHVCDYYFYFSQMNNIGVNENAVADGLRLYPNPANEQVVVKLDGLQTVEVIDLSGVSVMKETTRSNFYTLHLNDLESGVYFVRTFDGKRFHTEKLIVR